MKTILPIFVFFCVWTFKANCQTVEPNFGNVDRSSLPQTIYASVDNPIQLVRFTGLTLGSGEHAITMALYLDFPPNGEFDSITVICSNKLSLSLNKLYSSDGASIDDALWRLQIDMLQQPKVSALEGNDITDLIFHFGRKTFQIHLPEEVKGSVERYLYKP